jgi:hypothetical protein
VRRTLFAIPALLALLLAPGAASAAGDITSSNVTTPVTGAKFVSDGTAGGPANNVLFAGTSTPTAGSDEIDLVCYTRNAADTGWLTDSVATGVATDDVTGAWSTTADVRNLGNACLLRAVPAGTFPLDSLINTAFTGPTIHFARTVRIKPVDGPNAAVTVGWEVESAQSGAFNYYGSIANTGISTSRLLTGANQRASEALWFASASVYGESGLPFDGDSGLLVDGNYGWLPEVAANAGFNGISGRNLPGFSGIDVTFTHNPTTGGVDVAESHPILRCNAGAEVRVPPASCTSLVSTGVRFLRTTTFNADGREIRLVDTFRSADGAAHAVKVQYFEAHDSLTSPSFSFPWVAGGAYATGTLGAAVALPPAGPWSYFARGGSAAPDGDLRSPQGARVMSSRPTTLSFSPTSIKDMFQVHDLTVPAGGDAVLQHGFALSSVRSELDAASARFTDLFAKPTVAITAPANGTEATTTPTTVTGTAADNVGVTSLTVNGTAVTPAADGSFSTTLVLTASPSTITVVAKDAQGNEATATSTVTFRALNFTGTSGNDTLRGNSFANRLVGLEGDDRIFCGVGGRDTALGNEGNDTFDCVEPHATARANRDTVNCGAGTRDVALVDPFDTVVGCERVTRVWQGSARRDVFRQTRRANDRFLTGGGNDLVVCGGGTDRVVAGAGNDVVNCADAGTALARRRSRDVVNCGAGPSDTAILDRYDLAIGCEMVERR